MARKNAPAKSTLNSPKIPAIRPAAAVVASSPVRNSPAPRNAAPAARAAAAPARREPSFDEISRRAYDLWQSGRGGSQDDIWFQAERELRGA